MINDLKVLLSHQRQVENNCNQEQEQEGERRERERSGEREREGERGNKAKKYRNMTKEK